MGEVILITGTDTGAGKTVLTGLLLAHLRAAGIHALAMKPFCTGPRDDAELLCELQDQEVPLDHVNPFHFSLPVAPSVAARAAKRTVSLDRALRAIRFLQDRCDTLLIEGVGGLFVPLGEKYMIADLIGALRCPVLVAARNKLGVINHALLTIRALENQKIDTTTLVLMSDKSPDVSAKTNGRILAECLKSNRIESVPFLVGDLQRARVIRKHAVRQKKLLARIAARSIVRPAFRFPK